MVRFFYILFTGMIGLIVLLLWFATDHSATAKNYNALWAVAPNLIVAFLMLKKEMKNWLTKYVLLLILLIAVTLILWIVKIQVFSIVLLPILLMLTIRYLFLSIKT